MNPSAATMIDQLQRALDRAAQIGIYNRHDRAFDHTSLATVLDRAAATAATLADRGVVGGRPVLVAATAPEALWRGYLASVLAGGVPALLPLRPTFDTGADIERKLAAVEAHLTDGLLLVQASAVGPCIDPGRRPFVPFPGPAGAAAEPLGDARALLAGRRASPDDPLHFQFTSGSTGAGKPVVVTHGNAVANTGSILARSRVERSTNLVCWLPLYHDFALVASALLSVAGGCDLGLLSPFDFLADPTHWLSAIHQRPDVVTSAPSFALDQVTRRFDPERFPDLDLSGWRICYSGAEPVDPVVVTRFIERFAPYGLRPEVVRPGYGLAEATLMVTLTLRDTAPRVVAVPSRSVPTSGPVEVTGPVALLDAVATADPDAVLLTGLGPPSPDLVVEIVDPMGAVVDGDDICGEVVVSGRSVSPGYRRADGTIDAFPGGRCPTGDIGFFHQGELYLIERIKNIIIRHGENHPAAFYEQQLARWAGVALDRCAVIQTSVAAGGVIAVIEDERKRDPGEIMAAVRRVVAELRLPIDEVLLVARNSMPRTTSGKKQHASLRAALGAGTLPIVDRFAVGPAEVIDLDRLDGADPDRVDPDGARAGDGDRDGVLALIERHARRHGWKGAPVADHHHLVGDLGFDSLALIELAVELESALGLVVPEQAVNEAGTVDGLLQAVRYRRDSTDGAGGITAALADLTLAIPQVHRRVEAQDGRRLRIDGRWITDFASVNYLGLDLDPGIQAAVGPFLDRWGTHPSWTPAVASPAPYGELEAALARLVGAPDVLLFPTITLAHLGLLSLLATRNDTLIVDLTAHHSVQEGAALAGARGATVRWFDHDDPASLDAALQDAPGRPVIAVDGVYSMTGAVPDLARITEAAAGAGGLVYVDDAHGLGVLGRNPSPSDPYGRGGGGVVAHLGLDYDHIVYVSGLSKAFSSMAAFVTCRHPDDRTRFERASTAIFSGPVPVASLATALAGLDRNAADGDERRRHLHRLTSRVIEGARARGYAVDNALNLPIVKLVQGDLRRTVEASRVMWDHGILFTPSVFPAAPLDRSGFRISITSANTDDDVDRLLTALDAVALSLGPPPVAVLPPVG